MAFVCFFYVRLHNRPANSRAVWFDRAILWVTITTNHKMLLYPYLPYPSYATDEIIQLEHFHNDKAFIQNSKIQSAYTM